YLVRGSWGTLLLWCGRPAPHPPAPAAPGQAHGGTVRPADPPRGVVCRDPRRRRLRAGGGAGSLCRRGRDASGRPPADPPEGRRPGGRARGAARRSLSGAPAPGGLFWGGALLGAWGAASPASPGQALLVPRRHVADWWGATAEEWHELLDAVEAVRDHVRREH